MFPYAARLSLECPQEIALVKSALKHGEHFPDMTEVQGLKTLPQDGLSISDIFGAAREDLHDDDVFRRCDRQNHSRLVDSDYSFKENVLKAWTGQYEIERHARLEMHKRHYPSPGEKILRLTYSQLEAGSLHVSPEGNGIFGPKPNRDIDVRGLAGGSPNYDSLGSKKVPAGTPFIQHRRRVGDKFSGRFVGLHVLTTRRAVRGPQNLPLDPPH